MFRAECAGIDISDAQTDPLWQIIRNKACKYRSPYGNRRFPAKVEAIKEKFTLAYDILDLGTGLRYNPRLDRYCTPAIVTRQSSVTDRNRKHKAIPAETVLQKA